MRTFFLKFSLTLFLILGLATFALAGNIDSTDKMAHGLNNDIGYINFNVATTSGSSTLSVTVSDNKITGYAWSETSGWINLHSATSTNWGVVNDGAGNLSGWAWVSTSTIMGGRINFKTASSTATSSVTIDSNGYFHGFAWSESKGWISFNCEDVEMYIPGGSTACADYNNYKVRTSWRASLSGLTSVTCSGSPSPVSKNSTVTWTATPVGGSGYTYVWSGDESLSDSNQTATTSYSNSGTKNAYVTVTSGSDTATSTCSVTVSGGGGTISVPVSTCSNGAINYSACDVCPSSQELINGTCVNSCTNGATNPSVCTTCPVGKTLVNGTCTNVCANGATNPGACDTCSTTQVLVNNVCTNICTNAATNPPACDNICTNGANNFPACNNNICPNKATNFPTCDNICVNGATNYPSCNNICTNSSTNYPACDNNVVEDCSNGATNPPACDNKTVEPVEPGVTEPDVIDGGSSGDSCSNGATNYPACDNVCINGATNYPTCNNVCVNGSTNFPDCDNTLNGKPCPSGYVGVYPNCRQDTIVSNVVNAVSTGIGDGYVAVKELVNTKAGEVTVKTLSTGGVAVTGAVAVSTLFLNPLSFTEILLIPFRLWGLFMSFLGLKRRSRPWGTVYDSITKQPLDPAYVILQDMLGREVTTSITDLDGRYGFFAFPGKFKIIANKTNYIFPSKRLAGQPNDELYKDLYFGDVLDIQQEGEIIAKNIPLDPEKFDWNEVAKRNMKVMRFYSKYDLLIKKLTNIFFVAGLIIAVIALLSAPYTYNIVIFSLYIVMIFLRIFGVRPKYFGWVLDKETGFPLAYAIVHIYSDDLQRELTKKVCDSSGRYYALVPPGKYYLVVEKLNPDQSHTIVYNSEIFENKKGVINRILKV